MMKATFNDDEGDNKGDEGDNYDDENEQDS